MEVSLLVDQVEVLESAAAFGGVELLIHGPELVFCLLTKNRSIIGRAPLLLSGNAPLQAILLLEASHSILVHRPALSLQQR